ncbi:unannotated protein [freshwater metagenome]|uniref:Unannotated protein n=1 Tax=freshwater metagenome TaxID=449393 RepID=A0A6J7G3A4_9ZZZZ
MIIIVKHLIMKGTPHGMAADEDQVGGVDHYFPDIIVFKEVCQRAVLSQISKGSI